MKLNLKEQQQIDYGQMQNYFGAKTFGMTASPLILLSVEALMQNVFEG
jgi:hypothetical protein